MSFGVLLFIGGHVGITRKTRPKYAIAHGITSPDMSPGGEGPLTRQIRALSYGEKGPKPEANVL